MDKIFFLILILGISLSSAQRYEPVNSRNSINAKKNSTTPTQSPFSSAIKRAAVPLRATSADTSKVKRQYLINRPPNQFHHNYPDGSSAYGYETDTVKQYEETRLKNVNGKIVAVKMGEKVEKYPDGSSDVVAFVADEFGYRPKHIKLPPGASLDGPINPPIDDPIDTQIVPIPSIPPPIPVDDRYVPIRPLYTEKKVVAEYRPYDPSALPIQPSPQFPNPPAAYEYTRTDSEAFASTTATPLESPSTIANNVQPLYQQQTYQRYYPFSPPFTPSAVDTSDKNPANYWRYNPNAPFSPINSYGYGANSVSVSPRAFNANTPPLWVRPLQNGPSNLQQRPPYLQNNPYSYNQPQPPPLPNANPINQSPNYLYNAPFSYYRQYGVQTQYPRNVQPLQFPAFQQQNGNAISNIRQEAFWRCADSGNPAVAPLV